MTQHSEIRVEEIKNLVYNLFKNDFNNLRKINIIISGKTGVGKSTLTNSTYRDNLAKTGAGFPVTQNIKAITKDDIPLCIYDTPGFELDNEKNKRIKNEILNIINEGINKDINKMIHCIWYCINVNESRIDEYEIEWIKKLSEAVKMVEIPIIVILTQAFDKKETRKLEKIIKKNIPNTVKIIPILAKDKIFNDEYIIKSYGLPELVNLMLDLIPKD